MNLSAILIGHGPWPLSLIYLSIMSYLYKDTFSLAYLFVWRCHRCPGDEFIVFILDVYSNVLSARLYFNNFLLTEREVCTEKYRSFLYRPRPEGEVCTKRSRSNIYLYISSKGGTHLVEENKKYQCIPSFPLKTIRRYLIIRTAMYRR
jgi:hypothetical protein